MFQSGIHPDGFPDFGACVFPKLVTDCIGVAFILVPRRLAIKEGSSDDTRIVPHVLLEVWMTGYNMDSPGFSPINDLATACASSYDKTIILFSIVLTVKRIRLSRPPVMIFKPPKYSLML
jgi:hypothetical protein